METLSRIFTAIAVILGFFLLIAFFTALGVLAYNDFKNEERRNAQQQHATK